uniref:VWFA domain-containing protein n=1 Tax=Romanomermis culicivorax TaxID=13658 RepID=A0A915HMZ4_ROMCU
KEQCSDGRLNSCDENADCIKRPGGYDCLCQEGYNDVSYQANLQPGRVCTLATNCPNQPTDLIFLVDGSGSIGATVFRNDVLRFVSDFSQLFSIGSEQTRIGVIQFSDLKRKEFDLNQYTNQQSLQNAIRNIQYLMGLTSTGEAINYMIKEGFNEKNGARPAQDARSPVHRIAIVITDGRSQDNVLQPANAARSAGVKMFAVGVTD